MKLLSITTYWHWNISFILWLWFFLSYLKKSLIFWMAYFSIVFILLCHGVAGSLTQCRKVFSLNLFSVHAQFWSPCECHATLHFSTQSNNRRICDQLKTGQANILYAVLHKVAMTPPTQRRGRRWFINGWESPNHILAYCNSSGLVANYRHLQLFTREFVSVGFLKIEMKMCVHVPSDRYVSISAKCLWERELLYSSSTCYSNLISL